MRGSFVVLALAVAPFVGRVSSAQGNSHVVRHDMPASASNDKQCEQRTRGNPSSTGLANRADPTTKGNKDCAPPVVMGHTRVTGTLFNDIDHDGFFGPDEVPLVGWKVQVFGPMSASAITDQNGQYSIDGLTPGDYVVCAMPTSAFGQTAPSSGSACSNGTVGIAITAPDLVGDVWYSGADFGFYSM